MGFFCCCCLFFFCFFCSFVVAVLFIFLSIVFLCLYFGFLFIYYIYLFLVCIFLGLLMCLFFDCFFCYSFIFVVAVSGREGCVLKFFCVFFITFFPRGKGYFILHEDGVRDSSPPGQSLIYISILEADISIEGGYEGLAVGKKSLFIIVYIPIILLLILCNFYMPFTFVLVYVSPFVCLFVHKRVVVQLSLSCGI